MPALIALARAMHAESRYRDIKFSNDRMRQSYGLMFDNKAFILVYERDGKVVGVFAGDVSPLYFSEEIFACDYGLFILPAYRGGLAASHMVKRFKKWALEDRGARFVDIGVSTQVNTESTGGMYERLGLLKAGDLYSSL